VVQNKMAYRPFKKYSKGSKLPKTPTSFQLLQIITKWGNQRRRSLLGLVHSITRMGILILIVGRRCKN
jgi:hypothetical protein